MFRLPFISKADDQGTVDFWNPPQHADWASGCSAGREYATQLYEVIEETGNPVLLASVIRSMVDHGQFGAVETGFCTALAMPATSHQ